MIGDHGQDVTEVRLGVDGVDLAGFDQGELMAIAGMIQTMPDGIISLQGSGITKPKDVFVSVSTNLEYVDKALVRAARSLGARTCGLTFTFGGLKISNEGEIESTDGHVIPGLFAAGELVGGLFYHNYPGGTGLVSGAVLGKLAGDGAGKYVAGKN
jgi:hypothetical protein